VIFFTGFIIPPALGFIILRNSQRLRDPEFQDKFGTLTESLNLKESLGVLWNVVGLFRIMTTVTILVLLRDYPCLQILALIVVSYAV